VVASHHQVLAVIHRIAGRTVDKRIDPAAEMPVLFKEHHPAISGGKFDCCAKTAQSAAHYNGIESFHAIPSLKRIANYRLKILVDFVGDIP
jgi:hypothetical protein